MKIFHLLAAALLPLPFTAAVGPVLRSDKDDGVDGLVRHSLAQARNDFSHRLDLEQEASDQDVSVDPF